jgi:glycosyltransferase involved in cell wall biosynthesis
MKAEQNEAKKPKVLLELRPALENFAGIPQETRLLFRGLRMIKSLRTAGMLQMSHRILARGTTDGGLLNAQRMTEARKINRYSRVVISAAERPFGTFIEKMVAHLERRQQSTMLTLRTWLGLDKVKLSNFRQTHFEDFVWRSLFAKTLPAGDFSLVTGGEHMMVCSVPWNTMHRIGLNTLTLFKNARYLQMDTKGVDIFISQTPYPARVDRTTALVVRYHDALPVMMPHTIPEKSFHQASHFHALTANVKSGAYFACVSEATRRDLLSIYPEVGDRAVTIHNMVSDHYFPEKYVPARVPGIIRARLYGFDPDAKGRNLSPDFLNLAEQERFYTKALAKVPLKYLLMVSTIEPRKNHLRLVAAWEVLKAEVDPDMKLVVVGTLGWDNSDIVKAFKAWIDRGDLFLLNKVPAPDLRVLYRHAAATVCPSLGEGFDFSGAESMRSGGVVIASDIPVHREVYDGAAEYFDPYSTRSLVEALTRTLYAPDAEQVQARLRAIGPEVAARYEPDKILPQWDKFLSKVLQEHQAGVRGFKGAPVLDAARAAERI